MYISFFSIGESDFVQVNVTTECQSPTQVRNLRVSDLTSVDMTFEWDKPIYNNGSNLMYRVSKLVTLQESEYQRQSEKKYSFPLSFCAC